MRQGLAGLGCWAASMALTLAIAPVAARADDQATLGWGRLFDNDALGDKHDRWHTGSYAVSMMRGTAWSGALPDQFGQLLEYRLRADIVSPANLAHPALSDRRYAGSISFGVHSQAEWQGTEVNLGADLVAIGPQTGLSGFQAAIHDAVGMDKPNTSNQIGNAYRPNLSGELGRSIAIADGVTLRPYLAAEAGVETLVRAGGDLVIGHFGDRSVMLRDEVTGQRYRAVAGTLTNGMSVTLGGDLARVFASDYLPDGGLALLADTRTRLRAGVQWQGSLGSVFYGVTYLSPEFKGQTAGQLVGSLNVNMRF